MPYTSPNVEDVYGMDAEALRRGRRTANSRACIRTICRACAPASPNRRGRMTVWRDSYRYNHPRKGWIWVEAQSRPTREPDGATLWHGYLQDVTERKRIEQALVDKEARLHATVEGAHDAILTVDEKGAIQSLNSAAVRMFGYAKAEAIGAHVETLVPVRLFGGRQRPARRALRPTGAEALGNVVETEGRRKDGALFPVDLAVSEAVLSRPPSLSSPSFAISASGARSRRACRSCTPSGSTPSASSRPASRMSSISRSRRRPSI